MYYPKFEVEGVRIRVFITFFTLLLVYCTPPKKEFDYGPYKFGISVFEWEETWYSADFCSKYLLAVARTSTLLFAEDSSGARILENISPESFCIQKGYNFEVFYGFYEKSKDDYRIIRHYLFTPEENITLLDTGILDKSLLAYPRSVNRCLDDINAYMFRYNVRFAHTVQLTSKGMEVRIVPSIQDGEFMISGIEAFWLLDSAGREIKKHWLHTEEICRFRCNKDTTAVIFNKSSNLPTVGNIHFVMAFNPNFKKVLIRCKDIFYEVVKLKDKAFELYPYPIEHSYDPDLMELHRERMRKIKADQDLYL